MRKALLGTLIILLVLPFYSCKSPASPEILPKAILEISMEYEPVVFSYNWLLESWCIINCIILLETNGVGGNISFMKAEMMYQGVVYETKSFIDNYNFNAHESMARCEFGCTIYEYDTMRITVQGVDSNGYTINVSKTFDVYYD
ncbi:hypothetical protein LCGC14_0591980 [marine sediment metagenome]|uniref:Uncharacterized protein n=1 Tax=marine sediment metagenome TaxID=412755 RepID=A0A0F9RX30_9ZZZZ|nr:hypothetical protein [Candidatus Aminicenantes bacterium]